MTTVDLHPSAPGYHPPAELLLDHAVGGRTEAEALLIDLHLSMCPDCREAAGVCDSVGGALLDAIEPTRLPPGLLNRTLAAIETESPTRPTERGADNALRIDPDEGPWNTFPGGIAVRQLSVGGGNERFLLMRVPAGRSVLRHRHKGDEWTVVLRGGFSDEMGSYRVGDFVLRHAGDEHRPIAEPAEDCVCLTLIRDGLSYPGLAGLAFRALLRLKGGSL